MCWLPVLLLGNDFPYNKITGLELNDIFGEESTVYPESFGLLTQNEILDPDEDEGWEEFDEWVESIGDTWEHSEEYLKLPKYTHKVREELPFDISGLYYSEFQELPNSWDETNMEKILFQVPYSVDEHKYYFTSICRIMPNFCDFLTRSMNKKNHPNLRNISKMFKKNSQKFNSMIDDLFANRK